MHEDTRPDSASGMEARADAGDSGRNDGPARERIGVGGGDENVAKLQLAARWAEQHGGDDDSLDGLLSRFKRAYFYVDSVTKLVDPDAN